MLAPASVVTAIALSCLSLVMPLTAQAETVLERIARTGVLNAGTQIDASPFAFRTSDGNFQGYAIEILELIRDRISRDLGREIRLNLVPVSVSDRFLWVQQGKIDLECSSASIVAGRSAQVDFSLSYFTTGTQIMVRRDLPLPSGTFRVGLIPNTTNAITIEQRFRNVRYIFVPSRTDGLNALQQRRIDGLASDGILLHGLVRLVGKVQAFQRTPDQPLDTSRYGCILPDEDVGLGQVVNATIEALLRGILNGDRPYVEIYDTWFGPTGFTPIPREPMYEEFRRTLQQNTQVGER